MKVAPGLRRVRAAMRSPSDGVSTVRGYGYLHDVVNLSAMLISFPDPRTAGFTHHARV